jgi:hypothetical protein
MIFTLLCLLPLFLVDAALWLRMLAVYPYRSTRRFYFLAIFTPTIIFKLIRVISWPIFIMEVTRDTHSYANLYLMFTADMAILLDNV